MKESRLDENRLANMFGGSEMKEMHCIDWTVVGSIPSRKPIKFREGHTSLLSNLLSFFGWRLQPPVLVIEAFNRVAEFQIY